MERAASTLAVTRGNYFLELHDKVRTGPTGTAAIITRGGRRARLGPNSGIELVPKGAMLLAGRISVWITGKGRTEIGTPGAIAAAEGTAFLLEVQGERTVITVAEGTVSFYNDFGQVSVEAGQQSSAVKGQPPTRPVVADPQALLLFEASVPNLPLTLTTSRTGLLASRLRESAAQKEALTRTAPTAAAWIALGDAQHDLGDLEAARASYEKAAQLAPNDPEAAAALSMAYTDLKRPDLAEKALAGLPNNQPTVQMARGYADLSRGDFASARALLQTSTSQPQTRTGEALFLAGVAAYRAGDLASAEASLTAAANQSPESAAPPAYLAAVHLAQGKVEEANKDARRASELAPESSLTRQALGSVALFSGRAPEAVTQLRAALAANPDASEARVQLAKALAATGDLDRAVNEAAEAVTADPTDAGAHLTLGVLFLADRDPHRAAREFKRSLELNPDLAPARTGLAGAAIRRGDFSEALRQQKAGISLDQGSAQAHNNLGAVYLAQGHLSASAAEFREALKIQPDLAIAHGNLALAYLEQNRYRLALEEGRVAVKLGDQSALLRTTLARIYMRQNRFDRALVELRVAEQLDPFYSLQRFYLSQIYRQQGRDRDALRSLFRGILLDPSSMVEDRLYSRVEGSVAGGENSTIQANLKVDGRADDGRISYFASGAELRGDQRPDRGDIHTTFGEGILGWQPSPRNSLVLYGSLFNERGDRPGRELADGLFEDPNFRSGFNGSDVELMDRVRIADRHWLTLKAGFRRGFLEAHNPRNTPGGVDPIPFLEFGAQDRSFLAEAQWETLFGRHNRDYLTAGASFQQRRRTFDGVLPAVPSGLLHIDNKEDSNFVTAWAEWTRQVNRRLRFTVGPQAGFVHGNSLVRPKVVLQYDAGGGNRLAALVYPTFFPQNADLLPVESWAQPFDLERLVSGDESVVTNWELSWERTTPWGGLFSAQGFYRRGRGLLIPITDTVTAPIVLRLPFENGEIMGGQVAVEKYLTGGLSARVFGLFQETNNLSGPGDLPYFPRWTAGARLDYVNKSGIRAYFSVNYIGSRVDQPFFGGPQDRLGSFVTADFRISWQENIHRAYFIQVTDLFDRGPDFYRGYGTAGRTLIGGVEFRF